MGLFRRRKRRITRLLVVEDEPLIAFDNEYALKQADFEIVATVDNAEQAHPFIDPERIDAAVLDVGLAGEASGLDIASIARARDIPVLFVTGSCPDGARDYAYGCLNKPYLPGDLVAAIEAIDCILRGEAPKTVPAGLTLFVDAAAA